MNYNNLTANEKIREADATNNTLALAIAKDHEVLEQALEQAIVKMLADRFEAEADFVTETHLDPKNDINDYIFESLADTFAYQGTDLLREYIEHEEQFNDVVKKTLLERTDDLVSAIIDDAQTNEPTLTTQRFFSYHQPSNCILSTSPVGEIEVDCTHIIEEFSSEVQDIANKHLSRYAYADLSSYALCFQAVPDAFAAWALTDS